MKSLTPIILIIAAVALFFLYTDGQYKEVQDLKQQQADYQSKLDQSKQLQKIRDDLRTRYTQMSQSDLVKLNHVLPDTVDNVRLVIDMDNIAEQYGMIIKDIKVDDKANTGDSKKVADLQEKPYGSLTISFSTSAPYDVFLRFLHDLEVSQRVVDITNLSVDAGKSSDSKSNGLYNYNLTLKTYWLR